MANLFVHPVSVRQALKALTEALSSIYPPEEAKAISWQVLEHVLLASRVHLLTRQEAPVSVPQAAKFTELAARLLRHEPVQYVLGETEFCGLKLKVAPGVLIPRPETEELAMLIVKENQGIKSARVLDIGTGSGCLALALKSGLTGAEVHALDISDDAILIAKSNARENKLEVSFHKADILQKDLSHIPTGFDIIVSNPPYVLQSEAENMLPNVLDFEPHSALFVPDQDPLRFYSAIAGFAASHLNKGGRVYFETNQAFARQTGQELLKNGFSAVRVLSDMYGMPRFAAGILE